MSCISFGHFVQICFQCAHYGPERCQPIPSHCPLYWLHGVQTMLIRAHQVFLVQLFSVARVHMITYYINAHTIAQIKNVERWTYKQTKVRTALQPRRFAEVVVFLFLRKLADVVRFRLGFCQAHVVFWQCARILSRKLPSREKNQNSLHAEGPRNHFL